jgi:hypothetical protein
LFSRYEESAYDPSGFALWRCKLIRRDRPLTREELFRVVPSVFSEDKHESRSERYTYIPTISLLDSLQRKASSHSLPVRPVCVIRSVANTQAYAASAA